MSENAVRTPDDFLKLTQEFDDRRHTALVQELGQKTLFMAIDEQNLEDELLWELSEEEELAYLFMGTASDTPTAREQVEDARERFDATIFTRITAADTDNQLQGFYLAGVEPGVITLMEGARTPFLAMRGDQVGIKGIVDPETAELTVRKTFFKKGSGAEDVESTAADRALVFKAATLLLAEISN